MKFSEALFFSINMDTATRLNWCNHRIQSLSCMLRKVGNFFVLYFDTEHCLFPIPPLTSSYPGKLWPWWQRSRIHCPRLVLLLGTRIWPKAVFRALIFAKGPLTWYGEYSSTPWHDIEDIPSLLFFTVSSLPASLDVNIAWYFITKPHS